MENCNWISKPEAAFEEYIETHKYSDKTKITYRSIFGELNAFISKHGFNLKTANERIFIEWLGSLAISQKTESRYLSVVARIYDELYESNIINENVIRLLIAKKIKDKKKDRSREEKRLPVSLNEKEFDLFIGIANHKKTLERQKIVALLLVGCGLREEELCRLEAKHVHLNVDNPYLRVIGKGNKEREVPIPEEICPELERYEAALPDLDGPFVGVERGGVLSPYSTSGVYRMIYGMMKKAGIVKKRMSPHVLRHTYATRQLQAGIHLATVSLWMGHDSVLTTNIYQHAVIARTSSARPRL